MLIDKKEILNKSLILCLENFFRDSDILDKYSNLHLDDNHPFRIINKRDFIKNKIWEAQLKVIFPLLEEERINLIEKHKEELEYVLTSNEILNREHGERIVNPYDLEIGVLDRMTNTPISKNQNQLRLNSSKENNRLKLIHNLRNSIAHHEACDINRIKEFLDFYPFAWE